MAPAPGVEEFQRLFRTFTRSAWRWECQYVYREPDEREPLRKFLAGEPRDDAWREDFLAMVREATEAGKSFGRVRLMSDPLNDYLAFEMDLAVTGNVPAGEDIRILWPQQLAGLDLPAHDFWIFDDAVVARMAFDDNGLSGIEIITGAEVEQYRRWQRTAWEHSLPFEAYTAALR